MSNNPEPLLIDESTETLLRQLLKDEQELIEAVDECNKWEEEEKRLKIRVDALGKAIEILS